MFLLRAVLNILVRNASPRGPMCFRCLIFNLSGPCELLFLLCFIASWTCISPPSIGQIIENIINTSPITNIVYKLNCFPDRLFS